MEINILRTNNERSLAHIEEIKELVPLPGYDRVVHAQILGWRCIVGKDDFKVGDKCVYFEIDSLVNPEDERFAFLEKRNYKIRTIKMCKVISQGLAMPLSVFPELGDLSVGTDVTKELKVTYYNPEDRKRKSNTSDPNAKYQSMASRHPNLFRRKPIRWLMRREWGKKLLFIFFGKKKDNPKGFPSWIKRSDEVRIENMPWILSDRDKRYSVTSKIDGTSSTYGIEKKKRGYDFIVCSRNVRQKDRDQECYHDLNVYWEMADKYDIEQKLTNFVKKIGAERVYLQGETYGPKVQGNPLKVDERQFAAFNFWVDGKRYTNEELFVWCDQYNIPHVPVVFEHHQIPDNIDDMKLEAEGASIINPQVLREGLVYREESNPDMSFKNVAMSYLLSKKGD